VELDPDRRLALAYVPAAHRDAVESLWRLDLALGSVLATGREPMIGQIRLAWWRESLEKLDRERPPAEPVLQALAVHVLPGVTGAELAAMEQGWSVLLAPGPLGPAELDSYADARGGLLFRYSARLLAGASCREVDRAGESWALVDLGRHSSDSGDVAVAIAAARCRETPFRWPVRLRPLGMLAMLARRDAAAAPSWEVQGAPGRMLRMLRHRLTGY
jgi:15-cis-phytoene synthase